MRKTIILLTVFSLVLSFGCGEKNEKDLVVARVDQNEITVADFEETVEKLENKYLPETSDLEGKKKALDIIIDKEVMAIKAKAAGYDKEDWFVDFWEGFKQPFLVASLMEHKIRRKVEVTEEEVENYWNEMHYEYTLSQIIVPNEEDAVEVREEIMAGMDFEDAAEKYSIGPGAEDGGFIGSRPVGEILWWVEEALFEMEEGEVSQPLQTTIGYALLKLHKKRKIVPEKDKAYAGKRVRAIKQKQGIENYKKKIEKEIGLTFFPDAIDIAYNSLPEDVPMGDIFTRKVERSTAPSPDIPDKYKDKIICQYEDGVVTLKDFVDIYNAMGLPERPRREYGKRSVVQAVHKYVFDKVLAAYAEKKEKILEIPEVARTLAKRKEQFLVHTLYNQQIKKMVNVTSAEMKDFYEKNKESIFKKEKRNFAIIVVGDKSTAEEVVSKARAGASFEKLATVYSEDPTASENMGKTGLVNRGHYPEYDQYAFSLKKEGTIAGPFEISRGWAVIKLLEIQEPEQPAFSEAAGEIKRMLTEQKAEEKLQEKLKKWREDYIIEVYEENLKEAELTRTRV